MKSSVFLALTGNVHQPRQSRSQGRQVGLIVGLFSPDYLQNYFVILEYLENILFICDEFINCLYINLKKI
ncbi:hypothetical protein Avbf_14005 [Armadillidium vulgare]|nr:hypothetical protein Avbf_14005 [Armadillidium vulgare]